MRWVAAPLAAVIVALTLLFGACGDDGAEPGASDEATLVLDFQPNAVHAGIYAAQASGAYEEAGIALDIREPSASTDAPKLLESGRAQVAILDIHDLALARERGIDLVGVGAIVQRPLAAVIAGDKDAIRAPSDLAGASVGVTGLPSDDAVLDSVLDSGGIAPDDVDRVTIGFDSVAALASERLDAATAFWNAEGVALRRRGVLTREFRVDEFGAPRYPELIMTTTAQTLEQEPDLIESIVDATGQGYAEMASEPDTALDPLLDAVPELDPDEQRAQLDALVDAGALAPNVDLDRDILEDWARWEADQGLVDEPPDVGRLFPTT